MFDSFISHHLADLKTKPAFEANWPQVHAFRLTRHHLLRRAPRSALLEVASDIGGAQAQVMSAAELQLAVRSRAKVEDVRAALWSDRTLVKTWLVRGTLHLIPATDLPLYSAAMRNLTWAPAWFKWLRMNERELESLIAAMGDVLSDKPMTKEELTARVGRGRPAHVREAISGSWGSLLKPAARRGLLAFGPSRGTNVTLVNPRHWLRGWKDFDTDGATAELARRYLRAYGPATKKDFVRWFGYLRRGRVDPWPALAGELVDIDVEGTRLQLLAKDVRALAKTPPAPTVQLLPPFDPYLMGHTSRDHLFDKIHRWKVSRVAGWISAVVLVGGRVEGTWMHSRSGDVLVVNVVPFASLSASTRREVGNRAQELATALGLASADVRIPNAAKRDNRGDGSVQRRR
jgi:hypothetical protein